MPRLEPEGVRWSKRGTGSGGGLEDIRGSRRVELPRLVSRRVGQSARSGVFKGLDVAVDACKYVRREMVIRFCKY